MQKAEFAEWRRLRGLLESNSGCVVWPVTAVVLLSVFVERITRHTSTIEKNLGLSFNYKDITFYTQTIQPSDSITLERVGQTYVDNRNAFSDLLADEDLPAEVGEEFFELEKNVNRLVAENQFRQAIELAFKWLETLSSSPRGQEMVGKVRPDGTGMTKVWFAFSAEVKRLISSVYRQIPESTLIINDPSYFYLKAAIYLMQANSDNLFSSISSETDEQTILDLLEQAGYENPAQFLADLKELS